jgi:hypothetical protein
MSTSKLSCQVDWLLQACPETTPDRRPALAATVVGDETIVFRGGVQLILDVALLERSVVERVVSATLATCPRGRQ